MTLQTGVSKLLGGNGINRHETRIFWTVVGVLQGVVVRSNERNSFFRVQLLNLPKIEIAMTTQVCELVAYGETAGAPLCICSLASAQVWQGTEHDQIRYWEVVESMSHAMLFQLDAHYRFFNTETGNFALFRSADGTELVVAEVLTADEFAALPWRGLRFSGNLHTRTPLQLRGLTCFFDAALTLPESLLPQAALYALDKSAPWNTAVLDCHYDAAYEVMFKSDTLHLEGLCFRREAL